MDNDYWKNLYHKSQNNHLKLTQLYEHTIKSYQNRIKDLTDKNEQKIAIIVSLHQQLQQGQLSKTDNSILLQQQQKMQSIIDELMLENEQLKQDQLPLSKISEVRQLVNQFKFIHSDLLSQLQ